MSVTYTDEMQSPPRAWAEISLAGLRHNLSVAKKRWENMAMMAVVKAGAYGHGLEQIAKVFSDENVEFLGVANVGEARRISQAGISTRIYLLGATWSAEREEITASGYTPCISSIAEADHFQALAKSMQKNLRVHLAVDTGMGRGGFVENDLPEAVKHLLTLDHLTIEGIGSHLPSADEDAEFTRWQFAEFQELIKLLESEVKFRYRHLSNSAGLMGYEQGMCNLARPGLMLYGVSPLADWQDELQNVMTLKSRVTLVRTLPKGHGVSYGRAYVTPRDTRVATVGIGYGDGYPRHVSGHDAAVWIKGEKCKLLGRVTMDQVMVDVTDFPEIQEGDEVELFGSHISVADVARQADTIPWHIFTGITPRVDRNYLS